MTVSGCVGKKVEIAEKIQTRSFKLERSSIDEAKRTVALSFSSETPVPRYFGNEILDHSPGACDLSRLNDSAALLVEHNPLDQVGVVESAEIATDRKGRAVVRFGKSERAQEVFQDVLDGIRTLVSVSYEIREMELASKVGGVESYRVKSWLPYEISFVAIPADPSVGAGRSQTIEPNSMNKHILLDAVAETGGNGTAVVATPAPAATPNLTVIAERATTAERSRINDIQALGSKRKVDGAKVGEFITNGRSLAEFREFLTNNSPSVTPVATADPNIGMSTRDIRSYSLVKAIRESAEGKLSGIEKEVSDAVAKRTRIEPKGFLIPHDVMGRSMRETHGVSGSRALSTTTSSAGGYTVDTEVLGDSMIELLRNKTLVSKLGVKTLSGLIGNVTIPKQSGAATAYWLAEGASVTASDQTFGQVVLTPRRLVGDTAYSKDLLAQSSIDVEGFVRDDLMRVLAIAKDLAVINGSGTGQPLGILNLKAADLSTAVTFGAAATFAKFIEFETNVATNNADDGALAYLTTPATRGKAKGIPKISGAAAGFLWADNMINDYPAFATNQVPSNKVIFGNWADCIIGEWAGIDIVVDPYSLKKSGQIEITTTLYCDVVFRHGKSFAISTDSGAQ